MTKEEKDFLERFQDKGTKAIFIEKIKLNRRKKRKLLKSDFFL